MFEGPIKRWGESFASRKIVAPWNDDTLLVSYGRSSTPLLRVAKFARAKHRMDSFFISLPPRLSIILSAVERGYASHLHGYQNEVQKRRVR